MWKGNRSLKEFKEFEGARITTESFQDDIEYGGELFRDVNKGYMNAIEEGYA